MTTPSLAAIVQAPHRDNANRIFRALTLPWGEPIDGAPDPGRTFSIPLGPQGGNSISHYGAFFTGTVAGIVQGIVLDGFPQGIDWPAFNLTAQKAQQAWNTLEIGAAESDDIAGDWSAFINGKGISRIEP